MFIAGSILIRGWFWVGVRNWDFLNLGFRLLFFMVLTVIFSFISVGPTEEGMKIFSWTEIILVALKRADYKDFWSLFFFKIVFVSSQLKFD